MVKPLFGIFSLLLVLLIACNPSRKQDVDVQQPAITKENTRKQVDENKKKNDTLHSILTTGDSVLHMIHDGEKLLYESLTINDTRVYNHLYPLVEDDFLFEDKFYLKIKFPLAISGEITFSLPHSPDYVYTPLENNQTQVVINNALDLNQIFFQFKYLPSDGDSLVESEYSFRHVVFE